MDPSMMDAEIDGVPFGQIMQQAVKLKSHQTKPDRYKFDSYPKFKQHSMFAKEKLLEARKAQFKERLEAAREFKTQGDKHLLSGSPLDASTNHEYALSVFRYLENTDPDWKNHGIQDSDIIEHDYTPQSEEEKAELHLLYIACYLNLARDYTKQGDVSTAIQACNFALEIDAECDKALLLRAQIRMKPASAGATELEMAIRDAAKAKDILDKKENKTPVEQKRQRETSRYLNQLRGEAKDQRVRDKEWGELFARGEIYDGGTKARVEKVDPAKEEATRRIVEAESLMAMYVQQGKREEAAELSKQIERAKEQMYNKKATQKEASPTLANLDFRNPTKEMIEDAKKQGLDLTDERIVRALCELQEEQKTQGGTIDDDAIDRKFREQDQKAREGLSELVSGLSKKECLHALSVMDIQDDEEDENVLRRTLVDALLERAHNGEPIPDFSGSVEPASNNSWQNYLLPFLVVLFAISARAFYGFLFPPELPSTETPLDEDFDF